MSHTESIKSDSQTGTLTSEGIDGTIFKLHERVKGPAAADLRVRVRGWCGSCCGGNSGGLSCCVRLRSFSCDGPHLCDGKRCNFFIHQSWGSGHLKSGLRTLIRTAVEVRPSAGLSLTTLNCERLLLWWGLSSWSGAFKQGIFILCKVKGVATSWSAQKGLESKSSSGFIRIPAWFRAKRFLTRHTTDGLKVKAAAFVILAHGVTLARPPRVKTVFTAVQTRLLR